MQKLNASNGRVLYYHENIEYKMSHNNSPDFNPTGFVS